MHQATRVQATLLKATCLVLLHVTFAQAAQPDVLQILRKLAADRIKLDRCVEHPGFRKEAMNASALFLDAMPISARLDRLVNDFRYTASNPMLYVGYANILKQLQTLENANLQSHTSKAEETIGTACDAKRLDAVRADLPVLEQQLKPYIAQAR